MLTSARRPRPTWAALLAVLAACGSGLPEVRFSSEEPPADLLLAELNAASETVLAAVYTFTEPDLAEALERAHDRGVTIRLITDATQANTLPAQETIVTRLRAAGIAVCERNGVAGGIMHHKFTVIDGRWVLTGSFNWTDAANLRNAEDLLRLDDPLIAERYAAVHEDLWSCDEETGE